MYIAMDKDELNNLLAEEIHQLGTYRQWADIMGETLDMLIAALNLHDAKTLENPLYHIRQLQALFIMLDDKEKGYIRPL